MTNVSLTIDRRGRVTALGDSLRAALPALPSTPRLRIGDVLVNLSGAPLDRSAAEAMLAHAPDSSLVRLRDDPGGRTYEVRATSARRGFLRRPHLIVTLTEVEAGPDILTLGRAADLGTITATFAPDGTILAANAAFLRLFDYVIEDIQGENHQVLTNPERRREADYRKFWRDLRGGAIHQMTLEHRTRGDRPIWLRAAYIPVAAPDGTVERVCLIAQDVTDARTLSFDAQDKLKALDASLAEIEFAPDGTILRANANFLRVFDYAEADVVGRHHRIFVDFAVTAEDSYDRFWRELRRGEFASGQFFRLGRDGKRVWIQATYNPVFGPDGKVVRIAKYASDVTERVERDALLRGEVDALHRSTAVIQFDLDGTILDANANALALMGYERPDQMVGRSHADFVSKEDSGSRDYAAFWKSLRAGDVQSGKFVRRTKDGRDVWIRATYNPMLDDRGRVARIVAFASDVTEVHAEWTRTKSRIEAIDRSQGVVEFDMAGHVTKVNDIFLGAVGYTREEVIGRHHALFCDTAYVQGPEYKALWDDLRAGRFVSGEFQRRSRDGAVVYLRGVYNPILDLSGKPVGVFKSAVDMTAEVEARSRVELLSLLTDETDHSVVITDRHGHIEYVNRGFTALTDYTIDEVRGRKPGAILQGPRTDRATVERVRGHIARRESFYEEILNYTRGGRPYWISLAVSPILDDTGEIERFVSIQTDIDASKRRNLEYTRQLDAISSTSAVAEWDPAGQPLSRNRYLTEMGGTARSLADLLPAGERACVGNGETVRREVSWPRVGDEPMILDAVFNSVSDDEGAITKILMFGVDVTERNAVVRSAMATIDGSTDRIEGMVGTIQDIANQTRTLSLNASVEASRAGDAGRGFAVVAGEVRGLADRATQAAGQIAALLRENRAQARSLGATVNEAMEWHAGSASTDASRMPNQHDAA